jgi:predicted P-loop ATPase
MIDFETINGDLLGNYLAILQQWLPNGKKVGPNWCVGSLAGEPGTSLKIHARTGVWKDFASGEKGGSDPVSLYAALHGLSQADAARALSGQVTPVAASKAAPARDEDDEYDPITDPPEDMPDPKVSGQRYEYQTEDGRTLGYVCRIDSDSGKTYRPRTPWYDDEGQIAWRWKGFVCPRPLYGMQLLPLHPQAVVVIVEGEKCADALRALDPTTPVLTWPGGAGGVTHVNWQPLRGRRVILWPDADEPGRKAVADIAARLTSLGCRVKIANPPADKPKGWDVADAIAEGWGRDEIVEFLANAEPHGAQNPVLVARTVTTTQAAQTPKGDAMQRVEVREEFAVTPVEIKGLALVKDGRGGAASCIANFKTLIEAHDPWRGRIWHDTFLERTLTTAFGEQPREWTDECTRRIAIWIQTRFGLASASSAMVWEAVLAVADGDKRNVLADWLNGLVWDSVPRLADLMPTGFGTAPDAYHIRVGECWLLSLVARALQPGCKVDTMPVFEGSQGLGKSSALAILGGNWFGECHEDFGSKDFVLSLKGKWLIEVAEMHSFRRQDVDRLKGIMSTRIDRIRLPYGRATEDHPRQSVFAGTTNRDDWQADDTGARRFWAVRCGFLNLQWLRDNREQLFAEAVSRFKGGETWWSVPVAEAAIVATERRPDDPWEEVLARYLETERTYTARQLLGDPLQVDVKDQTRVLAARVGSILRQLGWTRFEARSSNGTEKRWRFLVSSVSSVSAVSL